MGLGLGVGVGVGVGVRVRVSELGATVSSVARLRQAWSRQRRQQHARARGVRRRVGGELGVGGGVLIDYGGARVVPTEHAHAAVGAGGRHATIHAHLVRGRARVRVRVKVGVGFMVRVRVRVRVGVRVRVRVRVPSMRTSRKRERALRRSPWLSIVSQQ